MKARIGAIIGFTAYWLIVAGLCIACLYACNGWTADFTAGVGQTKFHTREDGTWWQSQYETHNDLISHSWRVAARDYFPNSRRFGWSVGYSYLGEFSGNNHAAVYDSEAGRIPENGTQCDLSNAAHGCLAWYKGAGKAKGITLGLTGTTRFGALELSAEGGLFYFRSSYDVSVNFYQGFNDAVGTPGRRDFAPGTIYEYRHATGTHHTLYYGGRAAYGYLFGEFLIYRNVYEQGYYGEGDVGLTGGKAWQATAGVRITW